MYSQIREKFSYKNNFDSIATNEIKFTSSQKKTTRFLNVSCFTLFIISMK